MRSLQKLLPLLASVPAVLSLAVSSTALPVAAPQATPVDRDCAVLTATMTDTLGDTEYVFTMPDGSRLSVMDPAEALMSPAGLLDPSRLTRDRAEALGLGAMPTDSSARATWTEVAKGLRHKGQAPPAPCVRPNIRAAQYTNIWAGYAARGAQTGHTYYGSSSAGTIPSYYLSQCVGESMTQWVGISQSNLVQAGYIYDQYSGTLSNYPFYEFAKPGSSWDTGGVVDLGYPTIGPNQRFFFSVRYVSRYQWRFVISNLDSSSTTSIAPYHPEAGGTAFLGQDGVFISERLSEGGGPTAYMNHSVVRFRNALVYLSNGTSLTMSSEAHERILMTLDGTNLGQLLGYPDSLDLADSNFSEHWNACD